MLLRARGSSSTPGPLPPSLEGSLRRLWLSALFFSSLVAQVLRTLKADSFGLLVMECLKIEPK